MAVNRSTVRSDVAYLRRRVKPQPVAPAPSPLPPAAASGAPLVVTHAAVDDRAPSVGGAGAAAAVPVRPSAGLDLGARRTAGRTAGLDLSAGSAAAATGAVAAAGQPAAVRGVRPRHPEPFPAPGIAELRELGDDEPVLRLNARESAIGSLIVSGATGVVWETSDRVTGMATADGTDTGRIDGTPVTTTGNRPLVGFDEGDAIVALRHVRELRRALFIGDGSSALGVQVFDGETVAVTPGDGEWMRVLTIIRIETRLELRAHTVPRTADTARLLHDFGFVLTPHLAARPPRSR